MSLGLLEGEVPLSEKCLGEVPEKGDRILLKFYPGSPHNEDFSGVRCFDNVTPALMEGEFCGCQDGGWNPFGMGYNYASVKIKPTRIIEGETENIVLGKIKRIAWECVITIEKIL